MQKSSHDSMLTAMTLVTRVQFLLTTIYKLWVTSER